MQFSLSSLGRPANHFALVPFRALLTSIFLITFSVTFGQNLVSSHSWTVGSGSVGIFEQNGTSDQNIREMGMGPYGAQVVLWKAVTDAANSSDGGWNTQSFPVDKARMYRFAVWIKKTNSTDGYTYFGCGSNDILNLDGSVNTNPYFFVGDLPELNKWYLLVGYVHRFDDPTTANYGGIYDGVSGVKVSSLTDFKFSSTSTIAIHRAYLYYDLNLSDRQYFFGPEVYAMPAGNPTTETTGDSYVSGTASFARKVGIGTTSPSGNLHVDGGAATELFLTTSDYAAIRGNGGTWLLGYGGTSGSEDISMGTQSGGTRTLTFASGGAPRMKFLANGNIGIGTMEPQSPLHIRNPSDGEDIYSGLKFTGARAAAQATSPGEHYHRIAGFRRRGLWISGSASGSAFARSHILMKDEGLLFATSDGTINPETNVKFFISNAGDVGIGTTSPNKKLTVNGTIYGKEVKVDLSVPGPDYVFEPDYVLTPLDTLKEYIAKNKHLPEVPSALEMETEGIDVGTMNMILLKKVEELTLYILSLQEELKKQSNQIKSLEDNQKK